MTKLGAVLALVVLPTPFAAPADDDIPVEDGPVTSTTEPPAATTTTTTSPDGTTTTTTTLAPGTIAPVVPATPVARGAQVAEPIDENPCDAYKRGRWHHPMRGRLSIGFSKSHVAMEDDGEGKQQSLVARIDLGHRVRRGWAIELELSKLTLDSGDTAKTGGVSLVKTFGNRRLAPYVLAGGGGGKYETDGGIEDRIRFGEIGAGVMLRGKRFSIGVDLRRGARGFKDREDAMASVERGTTPQPDDERNHYTRGRILALVGF